VKKFSDFTIVNRSFVRRDGEEKVTGKAAYAADVRVPGMLYAKILRPPSHASKLVEVDLSAARAMKDVVVVHEGDLVAVLHRYPDVAEQALAAVTAKYDTPAATIDDATIFDHLLSVSPEGRVAASNGDIKRGAAESAVRVDSTYYDGYCAHAAIEPHAALVRIEGGKATVWASTQTPYPCREDVAKELGIALEDVRVITPYVGGGFGGKTVNPQAVEAARLAKLTGKPVQVAFTRKEEFFFDAFHAAAVITLSSGLDADGMLHYWDYHVYCAGDRGAKHFYTIPNSSTTVYAANTAAGRRSHQFATGPWRAPGNNTNTFARESQMDIMAAKAGMDAVAFRLKHLADNKKMHTVLTLAADTFGWTGAKPPAGRGFGVACGEDAGTLVAMIAEVEVDASTRAVRVNRVVCAQDMGLVVNPEGAVIQMEGCITMGLGYALSEQIRFTGGRIHTENFDTDGVPRFSWLPKIETTFVVDNEAAPQGGGEPAIITVGAAIANAVCDATGARVFQLPITAQRIMDAKKK